MHVELLTIGAELISGATVNTNAADLSRRLATVGLSVARQVAVTDEPATIAAALRDALRRCDLLITTGGLGPTFDDATMAAIAEATQRPLIASPTVEATIRRFYARHHRRLQAPALRQADLPRGGIALPNPIGTAPGLWLSLSGQLLIALPGVPREMRAIVEREVLPRLKRSHRLPPIETTTVRTVGLVELHIERTLRRLRIPASVQVGLYPNLRAVDIRLTATHPSRRAARQLLARLVRRLQRALGSVVYGMNDETLEGVVNALLVRHRQTLGIAESCTGGLLAHRITNIPGSSRVLRGAMVAYHNDLKQGCLAVPHALLQRYGAVSVPVAKAMAAGVRDTTGSRLGLSITGVAGPGGGTAKKPVGLVYVGLADRRRVHSLRCQFFGDRAAIKAQAAQTALDCLRRYLLHKNSV